MAISATSRKSWVWVALTRGVIDAFLVAGAEFAGERVAHPVGDVQIEVRQPAAEHVGLVLVDP